MLLKSTRRKLFYALVAIFLVLGTCVVLYAEGWRLDFGLWRLEKAGGIFVRAYPEDAAITLNNKPVQSQIGLISRGTLMNGLIPHTYALALNKLGYHEWREIAVVEPSFVAEFKYAVLVPAVPTETMTSTVTNFTLTANGPVVKTPTGLQAGTVPLGEGVIVAGDPQAAGFLLQRATGVYVWRDLATSSTINISNLFVANDVNLATATVLPNLHNNLPQIAALTPSRLWLLDLDTQGLLHTERASSGTSFAPTIAFSPSWLAWATIKTSSPSQRKPGGIFSSLGFYNFNTGVAASSSAPIAGKTQKIEWLAGNTFVALQNTSELYRYDIGTQMLTKMADDVTSFAASNDGSMLAALERHSLEIFSLASNDYWRFNLPDISDVQKLVWYRDGRHLFVVYPDRVAFLDLADASLVNVITVAQGTSPEYDATANTLYLLNLEHHLIRFDFPR